MGRHGGGGRGRRRVGISVPLVVIGVLVASAIGFAIWLWSVRSVVDPIDAQPVDAYAVVVSSPSCTSGSGSTVIDLNLTPVVRSSLSACGRRAGERVAVQYLKGNTQQVRLAGTTVAHNSPQSRWLPIAIVAAGLLAVIATFSLILERRRSRHAGGSRVTLAQLNAGSNQPSPSARVDGVTATPTAATTGGKPPDRHRMDLAPESGSSTSAESPEVTSRIAVAGFPGAEWHPFRPDEIALEEDLFTHRGPQAPDA